MASHDIPIGSSQVSLASLNERSREIFRQIVESYLTTGEPLGSRNLSRILPMTLSSASVRNVMSDLEELGLIVAPHTSAGRLPTELGLRFFVDALMEVGDLSGTDRRSMEAQGLPFDVAVEAIGADLQLSLVSRGAGVGMITADLLASSAYRETLKVLSVSDFKSDIVAWLVHRPLPPRLKAPVALLLQELEKLASRRPGAPRARKRA